MLVQAASVAGPADRPGGRRSGGRIRPDRLRARAQGMDGAGVAPARARLEEGDQAGPRPARRDSPRPPGQHGGRGQGRAGRRDRTVARPGARAEPDAGGDRVSLGGFFHDRDDAADRREEARRDGQALAPRLERRNGRRQVGLHIEGRGATHDRGERGPPGDRDDPQSGGRVRGGRAPHRQGGIRPHPRAASRHRRPQARQGPH